MIYSLNEARNAEEYRAEKAAREKAKKDEKDNQDRKRYRLGDTLIKKNNHVTNYGPRGVYTGSKNRKLVFDGDTVTLKEPDDNDIKRSDNACKAAARINGYTYGTGAKFDDVDSINRNMRRHPERWDGDKPVKPKSESTIFDDIEII